MEDRTLLLDMLQPFRKALQQSAPSGNHQGPSQSHSAATKLYFDETANETAIKDGKRRSSLEYDSTPSKRFRTASDAGAASPWQINRFRTEVLESRVQIDKLEKQISHQHVIRKEMEELFENERQIFINERKSRENTIADMENRLQNLRAKETEAREQLSKCLREFNEHKHATEKEKMSAQREIYDLKNEISNVKINANEQISKLKNEMLELSQNFEVSQKELQDYKAAYEEASIDAARVMDLQEALDKQTIILQQTEMRLRDFENTKKDYEEIKVLQKRLINMPQLEKEAARLREENTELRAAARQNLLLEEQVQFFKTRMESLDPLYQNYCDLQKKTVEIEKSLDEWKRVGSAYDSPEPHLLLKQMENMQQRELILLSEKKDIESALLAAKSELLNAKHDNNKSSSKLSDVQNVQKTQESFIHRLQKKLLLVSRERDSYRQQLDCYEKELTVVGSEITHGGTVMNTRIEGLEKSLQGYKDLVAKMEEEMAVMKGTPAQQDQLSRLKDEILSLTKENEILRSHSDKIETQLEKSVFLQNEKNALSTKILHMASNPTTKAQENMRNELERANAQIQHLKYRIKKLEAHELEMSQKLSESLLIHGPTSEEYNQLKEQLESEKIKLQRMKEVVTSSSQEYKDVCYMLMGYKVDRISVNNYRLRSMYADSSDQYLSFKLSDGRIEMVQTDYSASLSEMIDEHLHHHNSFPVFLSELTLDLFKKTTMISDTMTT